MSEQPTPQAGLNPDFDLGQRVIDATPQPDEFENEAMAAARRLYERLNGDAKTGLLNQEAWIDSLSRDIESLRPGDDLIVYVTDVNGFKSVNDTLGHAAGDELLKRAGQAYNETFRRNSDRSTHGSRDSDDPNKVARLGGDEFAAHTLRRASDASIRKRRRFPEEAQIQANRLDDNFKASLKNTQYGNFGLTFSTGYAVYEPGDTSESLFAKADMMMFENKYQGKIDAITDDDIERITVIVPFLEGLGARVDPWLKLAIAPRAAA
jgi:diguanylate cyclase (GGDEF)-like protein